MKQILQNMESGDIYVEDVPPSRPSPNEILVHNAYSVVSLGTERTKVLTGEKTLLGKAMARPDQVQLVLQKVRQEGLVSTWRKVKDRLAMPTPLGYSSAGIVAEIGSDVKGFQIGDRVACAGAQWAHHAEVVSVPVNLCAVIPNQVTLSDAATCTIGAVAMQGVRQADIRLGETAVVLGLGFLGQITHQILHSAGARVFGIDLDPRKIELAKSLGMDAGGIWGRDTLLTDVLNFTKGFGADVILLTASSGSSDLIRFAGQCARDRARIIIVGDVPADVPRSPFYEKELSVYFSRSYGPGRYDPLYEEHGTDYPIGYVRWTENRNMQSYLELLSNKSVQVKPLLTHHYNAEEAPAAFQKLAHPGEEFLVGMLLKYADDPPPATALRVPTSVEPLKGQIRLGMIGAGNFGSSTLLPKLRETGKVFFDTLCTQHGHTARAIGDKFKFAHVTCSAEEVLNNASIQAVLIATRHDTHASLVKAALRAGKRVYVEKPLSLNRSDLEEIAGLQAAHNLPVMVGFNRRFSPMIQTIQTHLTQLSSPRLIHYRINAGKLAPDHWLKDLKRGGGRVVGEFCHFLDLVTYLVPAQPLELTAKSLDGTHGDDIAVQLSFADGSQAQLMYTAQGPSALPKEKLELFCQGHAFVLDNFKCLTVYKPQGQQRTKTWSQDKGYAGEMDAWVNSLTTLGDSPIPFQQSVTSTLLSFDVLRSLQTGAAVLFNPLP